jgi:hypothetical protein
MSKKLQTKSQPPTDLAYHPITVRAQSEQQKADDAIPVVLATEAGVPTYDKVHRKVVREYLLMSGVDLPKQVTMLDDHEDETERSIGSIRGLEVAGDELHGVSHWSKRRNAQDIKQDVLDGHLTDMSVGAQRLEETFIDTGKEAVVSGRKFKGPARVVTRWRPIHGAVVTRGADGRAVFMTMREYSNPDQFCEETMSLTYRSHLESLGMPKEISDEQATEWAATNLQRKAEKKPDELPAVDASKLAERAAADAITTERKRVADIRSTFRGAGLPDSLADGLIAEGKGKNEAAELALAELAKRSKARGTNDITPTGSEHESFRKAALDGLSLRIGWKPESGEKPAPGAAEFRSTRFVDLARKSLEFEGISTRGMGDRDIIGRAFAIQQTTRASDGQAYMTSGNFSNLLLDAQNKTLQKAYMDVPTTFQIWARQGESVSDFKNIHRVRIGEIGNQPTVEENGEYKDMSVSDAKESYFVEKRGSLASLTFEAMKNDDLGGFSRMVQLQGSAMKRTQNRSVYQIFFDNPTLSDNIAIFHSSSHGANLVTSALSVTSLNTMFAAMALQTGLNSDVILGIVPRYLVVASGIWATAAQLLNSSADPVAGGSTTTGNSNTHNVYGPNGGRQLVLIEEPILSGNDADSWYGIADSNQVDTVEYTFLQGEETPVFEQESAFIQDAIKFKVRQTWGVKCIDYRGLYKSTG